MPSMMLVIRKIAVSLSFLLALSFLVGVTLAPAISAAQVQAEECCDKDNAPEVPVNEGECFDCNCPTCLYVYHPNTEQISTFTPTNRTYSWLVSEKPPSGFILSIDYPPEVL